jgi:hypothetical protein
MFLQDASGLFGHALQCAKQSGKDSGKQNAAIKQKPEGVLCSSYFDIDTNKILSKARLLRASENAGMEKHLGGKRGGLGKGVEVAQSEGERHRLLHVYDDIVLWFVNIAVLPAKPQVG